MFPDNLLKNALGVIPSEAKDLLFGNIQEKADSSSLRSSE